jgi:hypothetical protein
VEEIRQQQDRPDPARRPGAGVRSQLEEGVEREELDPAAPVELRTRNDGQHLLHHPGGARVAVTDRTLDERAAVVEEGIVHAPGVHPDAGERCPQLRRRQQARLDLAEQSLGVPAQVAVYRLDLVRETVNHLEGRVVAERADHHPAATGAQIHRDVRRARRHRRQTIPEPPRFACGRSSAFARR